MKLNPGTEGCVFLRKYIYFVDVGKDWRTATEA